MRLAAVHIDTAVDAPKEATQCITKMMTWNYEMTGAHFSINPQSTVVLLSTWMYTKSLTEEHLEERISYLYKEGAQRFPVLEAILYEREP